MLNQCQFIGRLGADPEIKSFATGGKIANLRLAVTDKWKDRQTGEKKERTEWVSIVIQGDGLVGVAERFLHKGSLVMLSGQLRTRKWQDQSGNDRYTTEVVVGVRGQLVMLDGKQDGQRSGATSNDRDGYGRASGGGDGSRGHAGGFGGAGSGGFGDDLDDDIPFATRDSVW